MRLKKKSLITNPITVVIVLGIVTVGAFAASRKHGHGTLPSIAKRLHIDQSALVESSFPSGGDR